MSELTLEQFNRAKRGSRMNDEKYKLIYSSLIERKKELIKQRQPINAEIQWIDRFLKQGGTGVVKEVVEGSVEAIVKKVLEAFPDQWFGSTKLAQKAVSMGLWENRTPKYAAIMSGALTRIAPDRKWIRTRPGKGRSTQYRWLKEEVKELV